MTEEYPILLNLTDNWVQYIDKYKRINRPKYIRVLIGMDLLRRMKLETKYIYEKLYADSQLSEIINFLKTLGKLRSESADIKEQLLNRFSDEKKLESVIDLNIKQRAPFYLEECVDIIDVISCVVVEEIGDCIINEFSNKPFNKEQIKEINKIAKITEQELKITRGKHYRELNKEILDHDEAFAGLSEESPEYWDYLEEKYQRKQKELYDPWSEVFDQNKEDEK